MGPRPPGLRPPPLPAPVPMAADLPGGSTSGAVLAGSVGHDAHNLIVAGCDDQSMMAALHAVAASGGGLAACVGEHVVAHLPLPIGGLMSDRPLEEVRDGMALLNGAVKQMGSGLDDAFMLLSFLPLEVIPSLRLTDLGLVDVAKFDIELFNSWNQEIPGGSWFKSRHRPGIRI